MELYNTTELRDPKLNASEEVNTWRIRLFWKEHCLPQGKNSLTYKFLRKLYISWSSQGGAVRWGCYCV